MNPHIYSDQPIIMTFDDVFTPVECENFIKTSHQFAYEDALITINRNQAELRLNVRNNQRVIYDNQSLAEQIFERVKPLLPASLHGWDLAGLNERFRFYLYEKGQTFKPHYDASYEVNDWLSSQLTLLIYLSEDFEGGETIFYRDSGMLRPCKETQKASISPRIGQVLIFEISSYTKVHLYSMDKNMYSEQMLCTNTNGVIEKIPNRSTSLHLLGEMALLSIQPLHKHLRVAL